MVSMNNLSLKSLVMLVVVLVIVASAALLFFGVWNTNTQPVADQSQALTEAQKLQILATLSSSAPSTGTSATGNGVSENQADPSDPSAAEKLKILDSINAH